MIEMKTTMLEVTWVQYLQLMHV